MPAGYTRPALVLCADGGGSKVCVVIRSEDGLEVRGYAGPCNVYVVICCSAYQQPIRRLRPGQLGSPTRDVSSACAASLDASSRGVLYTRTRSFPPDPSPHARSCAPYFHHSYLAFASPRFPRRTTSFSPVTRFETAEYTIGSELVPILLARSRGDQYAERCRSVSPFRAGDPWCGKGAREDHKR